MWVRVKITANLRQIGLPPEVWHAVVFGEEVVNKKPAPDIFLEAARRLNLAPGDCVVLEDSLAGATAGHAAAMSVIAVPEKFPAMGFDLVATYVVRDLFEARALFDFTSQAPRE